VTRFPAVVLAIVVLAACQNETHAVFSPAPSPTPHTAPTRAILQSNEVPPTLAACEGSGPVDLYIDVLGARDAAAADRLGAAWALMLAQGAVQGAISVFASDPAACTTELGATSSARALTAVVVEFAEPGQAQRAWEAGFFGFPPPAAGQLSAGLTRGTSTGLGSDSFTYIRPGVRMAVWRKSIYVAMVIATNEDQPTFTAATAAVDPRLN